MVCVPFERSNIQCPILEGPLFEIRLHVYTQFCIIYCNNILCMYTGSKKRSLLYHLESDSVEGKQQIKKKRIQD